MKIVVTGSLGHISKPLTQALVANGHTVTVISSKAERRSDIETLGAIAAIGTMEDPDFLTTTFKGADIVYVMETLGHGSFFQPSLDIVKAVVQIGRNYKQAIHNSGVKRVLHLSSIGAHMSKDNGLLAFHYQVEQLLNELPADVAIKFMRPVGFYYNLFSFIPSIQSQGAIFQNYGGDEKEPWVAPVDIATAIADAMETPFAGREIRYIASDEISPNDLAKLLGEAIGKPDLQWRVIPDEQLLQGLLGAGMNESAAHGMVEMNASRRKELLYEDYNRHRPLLGKTKLKDFMKEFAALYHKS